jgi:glycerophosphoryl diester phosphodiesterase
VRTDALPKGFADGKAYWRFLAEEVKVDGVFTDFPDVAR